METTIAELISASSPTASEVFSPSSSCRFPLNLLLDLLSQVWLLFTIQVVYGLDKISDTLCMVADAAAFCQNVHSDPSMVCRSVYDTERGRGRRERTS
jgi:hypothetical protein